MSTFRRLLLEGKVKSSKQQVTVKLPVKILKRQKLVKFQFASTQYTNDVSDQRSIIVFILIV